jgi:hypothetical protein
MGWALSPRGQKGRRSSIAEVPKRLAARVFKAAIAIVRFLDDPIGLLAGVLMRLPACENGET